MGLIHRAVPAIAGALLVTGVGMAGAASAAPVAAIQPASASVASTTFPWPVERIGSRGPNVAAIQYLMRAFSSANAGLAVDGVYGTRTAAAVRGYQSAKRLTVDGVVGPQTWASLASTFVVAKGARGPAVSAVQMELRKHGYGLAIDGVFGPLTDAAVRDAQRAFGLTVDGIVGPNTWRGLVTRGNSD